MSDRLLELHNISAALLDELRWRTASRKVTISANHCSYLHGLNIAPSGLRYSGAPTISHSR